MKTRILSRALVVAVALLMPGAIDVGAAGAFLDTDDDSASLAWFEGRQIDLTKGWGAATACAVTDDGTVCFRSEAQMDRAIGRGTIDVGDPRATSLEGAEGVAALTTCSSSVRLYDGASFTGSVLLLATRWVVLNLSSWGFDNRTSSYSIGACSAYLYSGAYATGSILFAGAWTSDASLGGWDNITSSVYIN